VNRFRDMEDRRSEIEVGGATWRLFVAISLPEGVKNEIEKAQEEMRRALPGNVVRWTKREQFHLTLKFLGNVAESRVTELAEGLREVCRPFFALRLRAERIGFFPDMRFPRVVWVRVQDEKNNLPELQRAIEIGVRQFTKERAEKNFTGHVTLGRIQNIKRPQAEILSKLALGMAGRFFGEWKADRVELIRSELSSGGSRYTTLAAFPLSRAP
jgi:RNA 2',3'-cyclic 3'-phosphodiesterase